MCENWNALLELFVVHNSPMQSSPVIACQRDVATSLVDDSISVVNKVWAAISSLWRDSSVVGWREHPCSGYKAGRSRHLPGLAMERHQVAKVVSMVKTTPFFSA